jgi:7-keto-8-aminopelargonate synthetase-like enzyme
LQVIKWLTPEIMNIGSFYQQHQLDDRVARQAGFNPYYPLIQSSLDDPLMINSRGFINLASNNYLGLSNDQRVVNAAINGLREYGVSMCSTPVAAGYSELFSRAEKALSRFSGLEDALIFPSCYQANNGLFQAIAHDGDLVIIDRFAHSSLVEGVKTAGCKYRPFRHNDMAHLEEILERSSAYNHVFVVTESVFSTEGSISPFMEINDLCLRFGAIPVVDDSHGIGVIGKTGRGILEHAGIENFQGIYTASLGKALASAGGMIGGKKPLIDYLRYSVSHLLYSTALLPAALQALLRVLEIIDLEFPEISSRLWNYTRMLHKGLSDSGYQLTGTITPIVSLCTGDAVETLTLSKRMFENGILGTPFIYPSVPEKEGRIRLIAGANLKPESIDRAIMIFQKIATTIP